MMKMKRKIYSVFFAALISIGMMLLPCTASAAENSKTQDGLVAAIVSEKDNYSVNEDIVLTFKVTNTNEYVVENVSLEAIIPDGLTIKDEADTSISTVSLAADESLELSLVVTKESGADVENTTDAQTDETQATKNADIETTSAQNDDNTNSGASSNSSASNNTNSGSSTTGSTDNSAITTGDGTNYLLIGLVCLACLIAGIVAVRFRKTSERYLSLVLCLSIMAGTIAAVGIPIVYASENDTESFKVTKTIVADSAEYELGANVKYNKKSSDDENAVTRGEWVDMLVNEFSMSAVNSNDYEIPYVDIADSKYFDSIFTAYYYAILPTDIEEFKPDEYASRDFAALTLNNCLCYVKNNDLSCDDFESIENKDAVSALVERGYFALTDNKFMPNKAVTTDEMNDISALIQQSLNAFEIDENHENVVDVQDNAVVIKDDVVTSIEENVVTLKATEETSALKVGDVFFAPNPENSALTVAYKVESVDNSESGIALSVSDPELYEMYKNIDIQGVAKSQNVNLKSRSIDDNSVGEGFTIFPSFNYGDTIPIDASHLQFNKTYTIDDGDGDKIEVKLNGGLENPELEYKIHAAYNPFVPIIHINNDFEFYVALKNELKFYGEASVTFGQGKSGRLQIAKIPVPICPGISVDIAVDLVVNANGKISIEYSLKNQVGVLLDKNGLELKKDFKEPEFLPKAEMDVTLGLSPSVELNAAGFIVGADAEIGAKASGKAALLKDDKIHTDLSAHMYFNADIYTDGLLKSFLENFKSETEKTFEIINKDNSPLKGDLHLEGMEIVNKCTYRYAEGKITNENSIPIDDVTVEVYIYNTDKSPVCTAKTNDFGEFGILIPKGEAGYPDNLVFKFIKDGYESIEKSVKINTGEDTDLGTIEMKKSSGQDEEIKTIKSNDKLTLTGTLKSEDYEININNKGTVAILDLDVPFKCYLYDEQMSSNGWSSYDGKTEIEVDSVQISGLSNEQEYYGKNITVTGTVMLAHTAHHQRTIVLTDCKVDNEEKSIFETMPKQFLYSPGEGHNVITIENDGSFKGRYYASYGSIGDDYPNGTIYIREISGKFTEPEQIDEYTYSMNLESLEFEGTPGDEYYEDGIRYIYVETVPGFEKTDKFYIYLPGKKVTDLSSIVVSSCKSFFEDQTTEELSFYVIYNEEGESVFVGRN